VHAAYEKFVVVENTVSIGQAGFSVADGFDLGAGEHNARHKPVEDKILAVGPFVPDAYVVVAAHGLKNGLQR